MRMVLKVRNLSIQIQSEKDPQRQNQLLSQQIQNETDPKKQNDLIAQQNNINSYISGLGIGVSSNDNQLLSRMKKGLVASKK